jgi:hypothetical protein
MLILMVAAYAAIGLLLIVGVCRAAASDTEAA